MKLKDIFLTASSNMFRSKLRTALTIIAIFVGAFTLTLTNGIGSGVSSYIDTQLGNLGQSNTITITAKDPEGTNPTESDKPQKYEPGKQTSNAGVAAGTPRVSSIVLTQEDIDALKANKDLTDVEPSYAVSPDYIQGANEARYKISSSVIGSGATLDLAAGKQLATTSSSAKQLILPLSYVDVLGYKNADDAIGKMVTIGITDATGIQHKVNANIIGVQQKGLVGSSGAIFSSSLKNNLYDLQSTGLPAASKGKYQSATAKITGDISSSSHVNDVKAKLDTMGYSGQTIDDQLGTFTSVINAITYVLNGFAVIALLAASFGIINTLLMSVEERTKEIGLMKAMGMRSSRIFLLFSIEAVLIGLWGSALGIGIAVIAGNIINSVVSNGILKDLPGLNLLSFPLESIGFIILLIMAIAFFAGTLPARQAAKKNPIDALRYE